MQILHYKIRIFRFDHMCLWQTVLLMHAGKEMYLGGRWIHIAEIIS